MLLRSIPGMINDAAGRTQLLLVGTTTFSVGIFVILCGESKTFIRDPRISKLIEINRGHYRARVLIVCDDHSHVVERSMQIDDDAIKTNWIYRC